MASGPETILVGPLNEPNGNILRRSLTLEGQRELSVTKRGFNSRIRAILHIKDSSDITKQAFKDAIAKSKGDVQKRLNLKDLAYKYDCLKHRKFTKGSHQLFQCFKITDGSQNGVVKSTTPHINRHVFMLRHQIKATSTLCGWINLPRFRNSAQRSLLT